MVAFVSGVIGGTYQAVRGAAGHVTRGFNNLPKLDKWMIGLGVSMPIVGIANASTDGLVKTGVQLAAFRWGTNILDTTLPRAPGRRGIQVVGTLFFGIVCAQLVESTFSHFLNPEGNWGKDVAIGKIISASAPFIFALGKTITDIAFQPPAPPIPAPAAPRPQDGG